MRRHPPLSEEEEEMPSKQIVAVGAVILVVKFFEFVGSQN